MTVAYVKLHCMTLHCGHCITLHYITHHIVTWITHITYTTVHYISSHCITLHCIALRCILLHYVALHCLAFCRNTLHHIHHTTPQHMSSHPMTSITLHCTILPYFTWYLITLQYFHACMYCIDAVLIELEIHIYIHYIPFLSFSFHSIPFIPYVQTYVILPTGTLCCPSPE